MTIPPAAEEPVDPKIAATWPKTGQPWGNSLGMKFVPAGTDGLLCEIWDVRVEDFRAFVQATAHPMAGGVDVFTIKDLGHGQWVEEHDPNPDASWEHPGFDQGPTHPVVGVSWYDAKAFCQWLTDKERAEKVLGPSQYYRLPTGAEWSKAVGNGKFPWGNEWPPPDNAGNYRDQSLAAITPASCQFLAVNDGYPYTSPVGGFPANAYGLFDMGGNVWQLVEDQDLGGSARGGSWDINVAMLMLSSTPYGVPPDKRNDDVGFRPVLVVSP